MKAKITKEVHSNMKYYKITKGLFVHYISTNKMAAEKVAKEKGMEVTEINEEKYMWLSLGFRPENFII